MVLLIKKRPAISSRDLGLEFAAICGKHFLGLEHLHYGYWPQDLPVNIKNLRTAQENYTNFLLSQIPEGVKTILDVGCGSGHTSKILSEKGYKVSCVSPSPVLSTKVRELMGETCNVYECKYEDLKTEDKFDLVLFSESFQYIKIQRSLAKTLDVLNPGGYVLISDVFRKDVELKPGENGVGGGHLLSKFYKQAKENSFEPIKDIDITDQTMPNMDLLDDTLKNVVRPIIDSTINFISGRHPLTSKVIQWLYRKKIDKAYQKYFYSSRSSSDFVKYKYYRLLLYRYAGKLSTGNLSLITPLSERKVASKTIVPAGA